MRGVKFGLLHAFQIVAYHGIVVFERRVDHRVSAVSNQLLEIRHASVDDTAQLPSSVAQDLKKPLFVIKLTSYIMISIAIIHYNISTRSGALT